MEVFFLFCQCKLCFSIVDPHSNFPGKLLNNPDAKIVSTWPSRRTCIHLLLQLLKGLLQRCGSAWLATGMGVGRGAALAAAVLGGAPWHKPSWRSPLPYHRACRLQGWVASGEQLTRGVNTFNTVFYLENLNIKGVSTLLLEQNDA